jgi:transposase-like protein
MEIKRLKAENVELRRADKIRKAASAFFVSTTVSETRAYGW